MRKYLPALDWIDSQEDRMTGLVTEWADVNTGTFHLQGLETLRILLRKAFGATGGRIEEARLPPEAVLETDGTLREREPGRALSVRRVRGKGIPVFLCGHMDTVFDPTHRFQKTTLLDGKKLRGPGVADAKSGLAVLLVALEALERSPFASGVDWEVLITPDEEIGSPGSRELLRAAARRNRFGLVYEPCFPDGALVGERKGSGNYTLVVHGKAAHVGRAPESGRNAVHALARGIVELEALQRAHEGVILNVGFLSGGGPLNVAPDRAVCGFNVRVSSREAQGMMESEIHAVAERIGSLPGFSVEMLGGFHRPAKPLDPATLRLLGAFSRCGNDLGFPLSWRPSGGACDGNNLAAEGLPTVDSLGGRGGHIHSDQEVLYLDSLVERARLSALFLMKLGAGEFV